jgi:UTP--glucose-1-phosphate uridylyltransferase
MTSFDQQGWLISMKPLRRAIFPAAGLGTRFLPATKAQPKEMLPLVDKPIIQYAIEEAATSGLEDIIIITGRGKNAIEDHFDVSFELEKILAERNRPDLVTLVRSVSEMVRISYIRQKEALGLGHAILIARSLANDEPFAVLLGDDILECDPPCIRQMIEIHEEFHSSVIAIMEVPDEEVSRYGVIRGTQAAGHDGRVYELQDMVEKPSRDEAPSNLAIIGRYILTPAVFDCLKETGRGRGGEIQLTDGLRRLLGREKIYGYRFRGRRHDAGDKLGFLKATVEYALKSEELGPSFLEYLRSLKLR